MGARPACKARSRPNEAQYRPVYVGVDVCKAWLNVSICIPSAGGCGVANDTRRPQAGSEARACRACRRAAPSRWRRPASSIARRSARLHAAALPSPSSIRCARACSPRPAASSPRPTGSMRACWRCWAESLAPAGRHAASPSGIEDLAGAGRCAQAAATAERDGAGQPARSGADGLPEG